MHRNAFHFMKVNHNDFFMTKQLLMLGFEAYINTWLRQEKYEEVYFFEATARKKFNIWTLKESDARTYKKYADKYNEQVAGFSFSKLFGTIPEVEIKLDDSHENNGYSISAQSASEIKGTIEEMIKSVDKDRMGFVVSADDFLNVWDISSRTGLLNLLENDRDPKGSSFFIYDSYQSEAWHKIEDLWNQEILPDMVKSNTIIWKTFENKQLYYLLERVNLEQSIEEQASQTWQDKEQLKVIQNKLLNGEETDWELQLMGETIQTKKKLYDLLSNSRNWNNMIN